MTLKKTKKQLLFLFMKYILPRPSLLFLQLLSSTYRLRIVGKENERAAKEIKPSVIYASLHQRFLLCFRISLSRHPVSVMVSRSRDAEAVARMVELTGAATVRGSSSKGKKYKGEHEALEELKELMEKDYSVYHPVDGPLGPFGIVKPGLIRLAQLTGSPIVIVSMTSEKRWVFNSWDKFVIPKPFSRTIIYMDKPICIPPKLDEEEFETFRQLIEKKLADRQKEIDIIWNNKEMVRSIFKNNPKD